jgi:autotransporter-associated beta strand protein
MAKIPATNPIGMPSANASRKLPSHPITTMKKTLLTILGLAAVSMYGANAQLFWNTNGLSGNWTDSNWGTSSGGPFSTAWGNGNNTVFTANSFINGRTASAGNITVNENVVVSFGTGSGSFGTGGSVRTLDVGTSGILDFASTPWSTSAGTGFIKEGLGVVKLVGASNWGGGFTLNNGTVIVGGVNAMGGNATNTLTINGGTIAADINRDLTGKYGGGINFGGNFKIGGVTTGVASGNGSATANIIFSNNVSLGSTTKTVTIGANGTYTLNGTVSGTGGAGLTVAASEGASGRLVLGGSNTYTGTTSVSSGTLALGASGSLSSTSTLNVASGSTFDVKSKTSFTLGSAGMTIDVGAANAGKLDATGIALTYAGALTLNITSATPLSSYDLFDFASETDSFASITLAGSGFSGPMTNSSGIWSATSGGYDFTFTESTGVLTAAIPEPSTWALIGLGSAFVLWRIRRKTANRA